MPVHCFFFICHFFPSITISEMATKSYVVVINAFLSIIDSAHTFEDVALLLLLHAN